MATTMKDMEKKVTKLEGQLERLRAAAKKRTAKRGRQVYDASKWTGKKPMPLGVYYIRIMRDATQVGGFGPYATIRAAAADAKNILRLNIGQGYKIVETGPVYEPVIRSDKRIKLYLHPEGYSAQVAGKGIISAQVIEIAGNEERKKPGPDDLGTFGIEYNPRRRNGGSERDTLEAEIKALEASLPADAVRDARSECGMGKGPGVSAFDTRYQLKQYLTELRREATLRRAKPMREAYLAKRRNGRSEKATLERQIRAMEALLPADAVRAARIDSGFSKDAEPTVYSLHRYLTQLEREEKVMRKPTPTRPPRNQLTRSEFDAKYWGAEAPNVPEGTKREFFSDYRESWLSFADYKRKTSSPYPNPLVSFKTRSGKRISFDAKRR